MVNPYDMLSYTIPRKWAEALVHSALQDVPLALATQDWPGEEVDAFIEVIATGATLVKEDSEAKFYERMEITITPLCEDGKSPEWQRGASDAWIHGCPKSNAPDYMAGWKHTCEIAKQRDFAEESRLINKYAP